MPWALPSDVKARWVGPPSTASDATIQTLVGDAERYLQRRFSGLAGSIEAGDIDVGDVKAIVARMVIRHLQNPTGIRQSNETEGPFSRGQTFAGDTPGELWSLTDDEVAILSGNDVSGTAPKAFSINPAGF